MKILPRNATFLAVALALGLFLIANHFDHRTAIRSPAHRELAMNPQRESGLRSPVRSTADGGNCDLAESELQQAVEHSVYCEVDDDCTLVDFGYPIQCMMSVAKTAITPLRLQYRSYQSSCRFRVYYDCDTDGAERIPVCRRNRCAVTFDTIESLKDETLDFLGIER